MKKIFLHLQALLPKIFISVPLLCGGCGYHAIGSKSDTVVTVTIPPIKGDEEGVLRSYLAKDLAMSYSYDYTAKTKAPYELRVKIVSDISENMGYMWDKDEKGFKSSVFPSEGRRLVTIECSVWDPSLGKNIVEPFQVSAFSPYDFSKANTLNQIEFLDRQGNKQKVLDYSLGQLDSEDGAKKRSLLIVYERLSKRLVSALNHSRSRYYDKDSN